MAGSTWVRARHPPPPGAIPVLDQGLGNGAFVVIANSPGVAGRDHGHALELVRGRTGIRWLGRARAGGRRRVWCRRGQHAYQHQRAHECPEDVAGRPFRRQRPGGRCRTGDRAALCRQVRDLGLLVVFMSSLLAAPPCADTRRAASSQAARPPSGTQADSTPRSTGRESGVSLLLRKLGPWVCSLSIKLCTGIRAPGGRARPAGARAGAREANRATGPPRIMIQWIPGRAEGLAGTPRAPRASARSPGPRAGSPPRARHPACPY